MSNAMPEEQWLPVVGNDSYEVSSLGRVRSVDRWACSDLRTPQRLRGKVLKQSLNTKGYASVALRPSGATRGVHALVAAAFLGPCPTGQVVLHGPNGKLDNSVSNLRYGTQGDNMRDRRRDGTDHQVNKQRCPLGHLLQLPNLRLRSARDGHRRCLACHRARSRASEMRRQGRSYDLVAEAARKYAAIMENAAA